MKIIKSHIKEIGSSVFIFQMCFKSLKKQMINQKIKRQKN